MADRPILFSATMVRALLEGRKTQTRRVFKGIEDIGENYHVFNSHGGTINVREEDVPRIAIDYVPYVVGDRLWVREAFSYETLDVDRNGFMPPWYWADGNPSSGDFTKPKPSIHMPRWASRLTLTVTDVRVQRLQEISEEDAQAEGCIKLKVTGRAAEFTGSQYLGLHWPSCRAWYRDLWDSLNAARGFGWTSNPWIVAITFTSEHTNIDAEAA